MIPDDVPDVTTLAVMRVVRVHEPDRDRAARIRARSHAQLARRRGLERPSGGASWRPALGPAAVGLAAAAYLAEMLSVALQVYGW